MPDPCYTYLRLDSVEHCTLCKGTGTWVMGDTCPRCEGYGTYCPGKGICSDKQHPGRPHRTIATPPCPGCFALDLHADWCPRIGETTNEIIDLAFTDDQTYWVVTDGDSRPPRPPPRALAMVTVPAGLYTMPHHAPRFARLRARIFGRSKSVVFGRQLQDGER